VDRGETVIVGVNKYRAGAEEPVDIRVVDNAAVRASQTARLQHLKGTRDQAAAEAALSRLTQAARGSDNLLEWAIPAARARATVGEMTLALEAVFGRHEAEVRTAEGTYAREWEGDEGFARVRAEVAAHAREKGRAPRMLLVKMGQDGHDRGAKVIATAFGDLGFAVGVAPLFLTPDEAAEAAVAADVDVVGVSSQAAGHLTLAPRLVAALAERGATDMAVVCGGVIPAQDHARLKSAGVKAIFGPGTHIPTAAREVLALLR
jgi:methylmalonyl-CoA mutase